MIVLTLGLSTIFGLVIAFVYQAAQEYRLKKENKKWADQRKNFSVIENIHGGVELSFYWKNEDKTHKFVEKCLTEAIKNAERELGKVNWNIEPQPVFVEVKWDLKCYKEKPSKRYLDVGRNVEAAFQEAVKKELDKHSKEEVNLPE